MGIRSATKKKLVERGVQEEYAKKLALDRTFADLESMTPAQIGQVTGSSPEQAVRIQGQITSWDSSDIMRRVEFRNGMNRVSTALHSLKDDIESDTAEGSLIDVNSLLIDHLESCRAREDDPKSSAIVDFENEVQRAENDSDEVSTPLQRDIFLELFRDDQSRAIGAARYLIAEKFEVPLTVMEGLRIDFRSEHHVRLSVALREMHEREMKAATEGLVECGRLDAESAQYVLENSELANTLDERLLIVPGVTVIEKFPMKIPRVREPLDKHPDDSRWPSKYAGKAGKVVATLCFGKLLVEFEGEGRPREFIHECHCRMLPSSKENAYPMSFL